MLNISEEIKKLIKYRNLIFILAMQELKTRYKHPFLGFFWVLIVPFSMIIIFILVFSYMLKVPQQNCPYFIFLISALFPWNFLNLSLVNSTMSILYAANLIKKVYFPREIIPLSIVLVNFMLFAFSLCAALIFIMPFGIRFSTSLLLLPLIMVMQAIFTSGLALAISSLQVKYRDIKYIVEISLIIWFYLTPVFYPLELVANISPLFLKIYMLNPLAQLVTLYRIAIIDNYPAILPAGINIPLSILFSLITSVFTFVFGFLIFKKQEPYFTDLI